MQSNCQQVEVADLVDQDVQTCMYEIPYADLQMLITGLIFRLACWHGVDEGHATIPHVIVIYLDCLSGPALKDEDIFWGISFSGISCTWPPPNYSGIRYVWGTGSLG